MLSMEELEKTVGRNLAALRKARNLTQGQVGERFNYTDKSISKWEHGEALPDVKTLSQLADFYGVTLDFLVHEASEEVLREKGRKDPRDVKRNQLIITLLAVTFIWSLAAVVFAGAWVLEAEWQPALAFAWALPLTMVSLWWSNRKWGKFRYRKYIDIGFIWSFFIAVYLECGFDIENGGGWGLWYLLFLAVPLTIAIVFIDRMMRS